MVTGVEANSGKSRNGLIAGLHNDTDSITPTSGYYEDECSGFHEAYQENRRPVANASATVRRHDHHVGRHVLTSIDIRG